MSLPLFALIWSTFIIFPVTSAPVSCAEHCENRTFGEICLHHDVLLNDKFCCKLTEVLPGFFVSGLCTVDGEEVKVMQCPPKSFKPDHTKSFVMEQCNPHFECPAGTVCVRNGTLTTNTECGCPVGYSKNEEVVESARDCAAIGQIDFYIAASADAAHVNVPSWIVHVPVFFITVWSYLVVS
jgi:hypothetical protein